MNSFTLLLETFKCEKCKLISNLLKIEESLISGINSYENTLSATKPEQQFKIKRGILSVIEKICEISCTSEQILRELHIQLDALEQNTVPERDCSTPNVTLVNDQNCENVTERRRNHSNPFLPNFDETETVEELFDRTVHLDDSNNTSHCETQSEYISCRSGDEMTVVNDNNENNEETIIGTAVAKLSERKIFDRHDEAVKKLNRKIVPDDFMFIETSTSSLSSKSQESGARVVKKKQHKRNPVYELPEEELKCDILCHFSYIRDPSEFYVRRDDSVLKFDEFENALQDQINSESFKIMRKYESKQHAKDCVGNYCCAYIGHKWYRVKILNWDTHNNNELNVFLIDYGKKERVHYHYFKAMDELATKFPNFAVKCHLAALLPPNKDKIWPDSSIKRFKELLSANKTVRIIYSCKEDDSYAVDFDLLLNSEATIGEILIDEGVAAVETGHSETASIDMLDEDIEEYDNINEAIAGYDAQDEVRICPFTNDSGSCFKGARCKLEHVKFSPDGITTDKDFICTKAFQDVLIPVNGSHVDILITGFKTTTRFFAQIITEKTKSNLYNDSFQNLSDNMNTKQMIGRYEPFKCRPGMGEILLVQHEGAWLRGICYGPAGNDLFEIFLVDYGIMLLKKVKELRKMLEEFLYVAFQAVECVLHNCIQYEDADEKEARDFFMKKMYFQTYKAEIVQSDDPLVIKMFDYHGSDFGVVLINFGLGEYKCYDNYNPSKDCILQSKYSSNELALCPYVADPDGFCFMLNSCNLHHVPSRLEDKIITRSFNDITIPPEGEFVQILITSLIEHDICDFYAHILTSKQHSLYYNDEFDQLLKSLASEQLAVKYEAYCEPPKKGEIILVRHLNVWSRALCVEVIGDNIDVFFVDFGKRTYTSINEIRKIPLYYLEVPFQAVHCRINNCIQKSGVDVKEVCHFFNTFMNFKIFTAYIIRTPGDYLTVQIRDEAQKIDFADVAVLLGLGVITDDFLNVWDQQNKFSKQWADYTEAGPVCAGTN